MLVDVLETLIVIGAKVGILALVVYFVTKKAVVKAMEEQETKTQEIAGEPN